jgi:hypothetical protein
MDRHRYRALASIDGDELRAYLDEAVEKFLALPPPRACSGLAAG